MPNPFNAGGSIGVWLAGVPLGDLGNTRVDARVLTALLLRHGPVARWLIERGVGSTTVATAFPGCGWPLEPPLSWPDQAPDPSQPASVITIDIDDLPLGNLGERDADALLLLAITLRQGQVSGWLARRGVDAVHIDAAFPGSGWS